MSWSFSHDYLFGSQPAKALCGGSDEEWMRIDSVASYVINQIGFENDVLAADVQRKASQPGEKSLAKRLGVGLHAKDSDSRAPQSADLVVSRREEGN
jgi:hypothetical protein